MATARAASREKVGAACGAVLGAVTVLAMFAAGAGNTWPGCVAAFVNRMAIGIVIGMMRERRPGWLYGLGLGVLLSLPDAIRTGEFTLMLGLGALGGAVTGFVVSRYGR